MEVVLDTVCLSSLSRKSKKSAANETSFGIKRLTKYIKQKVLVLVIDDGRGIVSEWGGTCGHEYVGVLLGQWEPIGGICIKKPYKSIPSPHNKKLHSLGFSGTVDRLIVRVVLTLDDRVVISDDSDFWDPKNKQSPGNGNAPVANYLRNKLQIDVQLLPYMFKRAEKEFRANSHGKRRLG